MSTKVGTFQFGANGVGGNAVHGKLRELAGFTGMALAVLLSAVLSIVVTTAANWLLELVGLSDAAGVVVRILGIAVAFVVDAGIFALVVVVLAGMHPPMRDLRGGAVIAAVGIGAVRVLGTSVVAGSAGNNALLASFAVLVTLMTLFETPQFCSLKFPTRVAPPRRAGPP